MFDINAIERFPAEPPRLASAAPVAPTTPVASTPASAPPERPQATQSTPPSSGPADMRFELDEEAQQVVVRISDPETGEVVRQIPSEVLLRVAQMIADARGGTVDARF